jgi:hypothetical protein
MICVINIACSFISDWLFISIRDNVQKERQRGVAWAPKTWVQRAVSYWREPAMNSAVPAENPKSIFEEALI